MGGGSSPSKVTHTGEIDKEYNRRMAAIAERELDMSEQQWDLYKEYQVPYEIKQTESLTRMLPYQEGYDRAAIQAGTSGLGLQDDYYTAMKSQGMPQQIADTQSQFLQSARDGIDIRGRMGQAQADVAKGFQGALGQQRLADSRMGLNPNSGASKARAQDLAINQAGAVAGARTQARGLAEQEQFQRLQSGSQMGLGMGG